MRAPERRALDTCRGKAAAAAPVPAQGRRPHRLRAPRPRPLQVPAASVPEAEQLLASMVSKTEKLAGLISGGRVSDETTEVRRAWTQMAAACSLQPAACSLHIYIHITICDSPDISRTSGWHLAAGAERGARRPLEARRAHRRDHAAHQSACGVLLDPAAQQACHGKLLSRPSRTTAAPDSAAPPARYTPLILQCCYTPSMLHPLIVLQPQHATSP